MLVYWLINAAWSCYWGEQPMNNGSNQPNHTIRTNCYRSMNERWIIFIIVYNILNYWPIAFSLSVDALIGSTVDAYKTQTGNSQSITLPASYVVFYLVISHRDIKLNIPSVNAGDSLPVSSHRKIKHLMYYFMKCA